MFSFFKLAVINVTNLNLLEHPELYKDRGSQDESGGSRQKEAGTDAGAAGRRQAATDEIMLDRFRKRERNRAMRR